MAQAGLLDWANSIRFQMANDPGRQIFQDQVQTHGFLYLSDYFDDLITGGKHRNLIDLVKTPGRKKPFDKKNTFPSKLSITLELPPKLEITEKANIDHNNSPHTQPSINERDTHIDHSVPQEQVNLPQIHDANSNVAPSLDSGHLSIIAESDESLEQIRPVSPTSLSMSVSEPSISEPVRQDSIKPAEEPGDKADASDPNHLMSVAEPETRTAPIAVEEPEDKDLVDALIHDASHMNPVLHAAPISVEETQDKPLVEASVHYASRPISASPADTFHSVALDSPSPHAIKYVPTPPPADTSLPQSSFTQSSDKQDDHLRTGFEEEDITQASMPEPSKPALSKTNDYPTLPGPQPLPKSMRDVPMGVPGVNPPVAFDAKRSSWLMKAREANGLDNMTRKMTLTAALPTSLKRKSADMLGSAALTTDDEARRSKAVKQSESDTAAEKATVVGQAAEIPPGKTMVSEDLSQEPGMLDIFKRTVDAARAGKNAEKSLGRPPALAEARAVAEARVAERNKDVSDVPPPDPGRLSLSELSVSRETAAVQKDMSIQNLERKPPPSAPILPSGPVFNKPVFVPPSPPNVQSKAVSEASNIPSVNPSLPFSLPASMSLGLGPRLPSPPVSSHKVAAPVSAQSTMESIASVRLFDSQEGPAWVPSTQETDYTSTVESQQNMDDLDADDSWMDEKLPEGVAWTFGFDREDSLTWSSAPTQSQKLELTPPVDEAPPPQENANDTTSVISDSLQGNEEDNVEQSDASLLFKSTVNLVKAPSESQELSTSQPQGLLSKFVSNVLGTAKKVKPEVKSLQLAAAAAKKEQEEKDKKAAYRKNMEDRRLLASQKRVEELKVKAQDEDRKLREEAERRKREREDHTDKRLATKKKEEETAKKRKMNVDIEKKPETKKVISSVKSVKGATKLVAGTSTVNPVLPPANALAQSSKGKAAIKTLVPDDDISQPSQLLQTQMAARAKAQLQAAKQIEPSIPSEEIDLPDIRSDYYDSDEEDQGRGYEPPVWAQSPVLRQALESQSSVNPDEIFGAVPPLRMEELFRGNKSSRFRARTSSANWTGADKLTRDEEIEYARRMGFRNGLV